MSLADIVVDSLRNGGVAAPNGSIVRIASAGTVVVAQANSAPNYAGLVGVIRSTGPIAPGGALNIVNVGTTEVLLETGLTPTNGADLYLSATVAGRATTVANAVRIGVIRNTSRYAAESLVSATVTSLGAGGGGGGAQGFQGSQGAVGAQGFQGNTGNTGTTGAQGFQGFQGAIGTGAQGFQGFQGATGPGGGAQGFQGNQGANGAQGFQGNTGAGTTGAQGFQGFQGATGNTGTTGAQGFQGFQGFQGAIGAQGFQGFQGSTGAQGLQNFIVLNVDSTAATNTATGNQTLRTYTIPANTFVNTGDMIHARYVMTFLITAENNTALFRFSLGGVNFWESAIPFDDPAIGAIRYPRTPHSLILDVQILRTGASTVEVTCWCSDTTNEIGMLYSFIETLTVPGFTYTFSATRNMVLVGGDGVNANAVRYNSSFVHLYKA